MNVEYCGNVYTPRTRKIEWGELEFKVPQSKWISGQFVHHEASNNWFFKKETSTDLGDYKKIKINAGDHLR